MGGSFDLIVLSEVEYYCPDLKALEMRVEDSLTPDGLLVACHGRHEATDHSHSAEDVHSALSRGLHEIVRHVETDFLLHIWCRSPTSVAQRKGIVP